MSIFPGTFPSLPGVSCDRFSGANLNSDQFFLSHCHSDHMVGLESLVTKLRSMNKVKVNHRIYCSMISKAFIVRRYPYLDERWVKDLFPNEAVTIHVFDRQNGGSMYQLRVMAIPANHCPGSVMFRFETLNLSGESVTLRILYTGDFRFEDQPLTSLIGLHSKTTLRPLDIDEMYLDTTFCSPKYLTFPKRDEALRSIWELVHSWIRKNGMYRNQRAKHVVLLHLPAQYGSEAILRHIYEMSGAKWRIHVDPRKFNDYLCSDDLGDCTDADPELAQWIHACSWDKRDDDQKAARKKTSGAQKFFPREIPCQSDKTFEVRQIKPSALFFNCQRIGYKSMGNNSDGQEDDRGVRWHVGGQYYRVCYSCHSSLTELMEFVKYFKPKKLHPSASTPGMDLDQVNSLLESAMEEGLDDVQDSPVLNALMASQITKDATLDQSSTADADNLQTDNGGGTGIAKALKRNAADIEGSDDDDFNPTAAVALKSRRLTFQGSKSAKISASMPTESKAVHRETDPPNRRASLPHNLKIPAITITPSSPSPGSSNNCPKCYPKPNSKYATNESSADPNHPDYPEFFQDRFYLETVSKCSGSVMNTMNTESQGSVGERTKRKEDETSPTDDLQICYESIRDSLRHTRQSTPEMVELSSDSEGDEDMESTPDLDVIASTAATDVERENCSNYAKGLERQRRKTLEEGGEDK